MPFCTSLPKHNPRILDLYESIPRNGREHEFLARYIKNNTEIEGNLFTSMDSIDESENLDQLIEKYNSKLYRKHVGRKIEKFKNYLYIKEYVDDCTKIIKKLQELSSKGISQYTSSVDSWMKNNANGIDDEKKREILRTMFADSKVALIYGAAGTGKTTLMKYIADLWAKKNKFFLANTHPAVDNLHDKVTIENSHFSTIAKFLKNPENECDILFIDECSTVSNKDMNVILNNTKFKLLVLVGDIYQIESIYFGNWFSFAQKYVCSKARFELQFPFRTTNESLKNVWKKVRELDNSILEFLVKNSYTSRLDQTIFERNSSDEIVLCLNYDGLYGINNINRILQSNNTNESFTLGINTYKKGDPVLFNESNVFSPLIHNNSKGIINDILIKQNKLEFQIELDKSINEIDATDYNFEIVGESKNGNSIISFEINNYDGNDDEDDDISSVVPFQIAYAISIHKAQGLEYNSVKIVITNEVEEKITHNIFYTAITRTKEKLKIYWSPETEKKVLSNFEKKNISKEIQLLAKISSISTQK